MSDPQTTIRLALAAGHVRSGQAEAIKGFMQDRNWFCCSPDDIKAKVKALAARGYENDPAIITTKILLYWDWAVC
jgi:hypothetical protein